MDFYPAKPNEAFIKFAYRLLPFTLRALCGVYKVSVPDADFERFRQATSGRCIITPNHPSRVEPLIVGELARRTGRWFYFVSARENFEMFGGRLLQPLGCYSIQRGTPDRKSIATTRTLLAEQDRQVVLFPEGEVYHHNDLMLPLHPGVAQMGFWALADVAKEGKARALPVVPLAVKYRFLGDVSAYAERRLARLEKEVCGSASGGNLRERVLYVGDRIIAMLDSRYRLAPDNELDRTQRIERIKDCILERGLAALNVDAKAAGATRSEQMRALFNAVREYRTELAEATSGYEQRVHAQRLEMVETLTNDLNRIADSILASGRYVSDNPTYERLCDLLGRMEDEVFGKHVRYPSREAVVRVAEPVELVDYAEAYKENKRAAVTAAIEAVASRIAGMLAEMTSIGQPIPEHQWPTAETAVAQAAG